MVFETFALESKRPLGLEVDPDLVLLTPGRTLILHTGFDYKNVGTEPSQEHNDYRAFKAYGLDFSVQRSVGKEFPRAGELAGYLHNNFGISYSDARRITRKLVVGNLIPTTLEGKCDRGNFVALLYQPVEEIE